jgi:hypothetical protein
MSILFLAPSLACRPAAPTQQQRLAAIQGIHAGTLEEYSETGWPYTYHPMIYAAWAYESRGRVDGALESRLRSGNDIFQALRADIAAQAREGAQKLDEDRFLGFIPEEGIRSETSGLMNEEVLGLYAFTRAWTASITAKHPDAPQQIIALLGKAYSGRPDLAEMPIGEQAETENTRWRDWLQMALAACGEPGVRAVLDLDHRLEQLQTLVPDENFWDGRLTHAFILRSIQLARGAALDTILEELAQYRTGGKVTGLHGWMYWNLAWTLEADGGMFPYTENDYKRVDEFLSGGLMEGPLGEGEEAEVIADALARVPSPEQADRFFGMIEDDRLSCERRQVAYLGLQRMLLTPISSWQADREKRNELRERSAQVLERGALACGNGPLLELYSSILTAFTGGFGKAEPGETLTDDQLVRVHEAFVALLPSLKTADERAEAVKLLQWGLAQPDYMMAHPELSKFRDAFIKTHEDWSVSTNFEGSKISREEFERLMDWFRSSLGEESVWVNE